MHYKPDTYDVDSTRVCNSWDLVEAIFRPLKPGSQFLSSKPGYPTPNAKTIYPFLSCDAIELRDVYASRMKEIWYPALPSKPKGTVLAWGTFSSATARKCAALLSTRFGQIAFTVKETTAVES